MFKKKFSFSLGLTAESFRFSDTTKNLIFGNLIKKKKKLEF